MKLWILLASTLSPPKGVDSAGAELKLRGGSSGVRLNVGNADEMLVSVDYLRGLEKKLRAVPSESFTPSELKEALTAHNGVSMQVNSATNSLDFTSPGMAGTPMLDVQILAPNQFYPTDSWLEVSVRLDLVPQPLDSDPGLQLASAPIDPSAAYGGGIFCGVALHENVGGCQIGWDDSLATGFGGGSTIPGRRETTTPCLSSRWLGESGLYEHTEVRWLVGPDASRTSVTVTQLSTGGTARPFSTTREAPVTFDPQQGLWLRLTSGNLGEQYQVRGLHYTLKPAYPETAKRLVTRQRGLMLTDPNIVRAYNGYSFVPPSGDQNSASVSPAVGGQDELMFFVPFLPYGLFNNMWGSFGVNRLKITLRLSIPASAADSDPVWALASTADGAEAFGGVNFVGAGLLDQANGNCGLIVDDSRSGAGGRVTTDYLCEAAAAPDRPAGASITSVTIVWKVGANFDTELEVIPQAVSPPFPTTKLTQNPPSRYVISPVRLNPNNGLGIRMYGNNIGETYKLKFMEISMQPI